MKVRDSKLSYFYHFNVSLNFYYSWCSIFWYGDGGIAFDCTDKVCEINA